MIWGSRTLAAYITVQIVSNPLPGHMLDRLLRHFRRLPAQQLKLQDLHGLSFNAASS